MLRVYLKAENLKFKRSLFRKLVVLIPAALITVSLVLIYVGMGVGVFSNVMVCNWCMPIASLSVVILCHLVNKRDQKYQYRTLYSLPVNLKKVFLSKTIVTALNLFIISLLLSFITAVTECMASGNLSAVGNTGYYIGAYSLLWLTLLWQIPFCLFLDQKSGFIGSVVINLFASAAGGVLIYLTPLFWFFPYSWPARLMVTLFGVLTNGLLADADSRLFLSLSEGLLLVFVSIFVWYILTVLFSRWYDRQVYRK